MTNYILQLHEQKLCPPKKERQSSGRFLERKAIIPISCAQYFMSSPFQHLTLKNYVSFCFFLNLTKPAKRFSLPDSDIPQVLSEVVMENPKLISHLHHNNKIKWFIHFFVHHSQLFTLQNVPAPLKFLTSTRLKVSVDEDKNLKVP